MMQKINIKLLIIITSSLLVIGGTSAVAWNIIAPRLAVKDNGTSSDTQSKKTEQTAQDEGKKDVAKEDKTSSKDDQDKKTDKKDEKKTDKQTKKPDQSGSDDATEPDPQPTPTPTPTPSPTPTPTPTPDPTPTPTPTPTYTVATTNSTKGISVDAYGNVAFTKAGTFSYLIINGTVDIRASNVTLDHVKIYANPTNKVSAPLTPSACWAAVGKTYPAVNATRGYANFVIKDSVIDVKNPSVIVDNGIFGRNMTVQRTTISGAVDGIGLYAPSGGNVNSLIEASTIRNLYVGPYSPGHGCDEPSHSDGIQIHYGYGMTIRNNALYANSITAYNSNAAIMINENGGFATSSVSITGNTIDYGVCSVNVYGNVSSGGMANMHIDNNRYGKNQTQTRTRSGVTQKCAMTIKGTTLYRSGNTFNGNTWLDGSSPAPYVNNGG